MTVNDQLGEILHAIGRLQGDVDAIKGDIIEGKDSRGRIHSKLEKIDEDVRIVGAVAAQARDQAGALEAIVTTDIKPATDDFKRMRSFGKTTLWAVGLAAAGLGITAATLWESFVNWVRAAFRIP